MVDMLQVLRDTDLRELCELQICRDPDGSAWLDYPERRYANATTSKLLPDGEGPFCRFRIPARVSEPGVYAFVAGTAVLYVGQAANLAKRFNMGYGQISPRNCYIGGQATNCRVNKLVLQATEAGQTLRLWFKRTLSLDETERQLVTTLQPRWNRAMLSSPRIGLSQSRPGPASVDPAHSRSERISKYDAIAKWLESEGTLIVESSLSFIAEHVVPLPAAALRHRAWWIGPAATSPQHVQKRAWESAGFTVSSLDLSNGTVVFQKDS